ncbi:MAG: hypothetical protein EA349_03840 [Halomonadaceae bacterium]|nr:MAG: hypothetical protein EA349_03840 [Halomonadaceae bacterium]
MPDMKTNQWQKMHVRRRPERFEWRAFAMDFGITEQRLRTRAAPEKIRASKEVQLLPRHNQIDSISLCNNHLLVRSLLQIRGPLELWSVMDKYPLPLTRTQLNGRLSAPLLTQATTTEPDLGSEALRQALAADGDGVIQLPLEKRRWHFSLARCACDITELTINGSHITSIGIGSVDPQAVLDLAAELGLNRWANRSYLSLFRQLVGLEEIRLKGEWCWESSDQ